MPALGQPEARPTMVGRYELVAPIGRGGMAEVHLAVQRGPAGFEKLVVIKVVHEHLASKPAFVEMLLDEARHAGMIQHPNVVEIYELGEEAGRYFIAMEYLDGEPLLDVLRVGGEGRARLDPLSIARVIADTAEGLDAAHRLKSRDGRPIELVHHDVSLGNIVVLYGGLVKLVDFGVAKAQPQSAPSGERVQGKLGYMSPEKIQDRAVDRRSDIWSLGCVLWEALTLQRLFKGDSDADTVRQVLGAEIVPPSQIDPSAPPELDPIVMRALQRDPDRRYQTAKGMAADLEEVLRELKYGAKNDRIAQHMESVFAARIAARERVLMEVSSKRRPSAATLEAAFGEGITSTITSTGDAPLAAMAGIDDGGPAHEAEESVHESTTLKTTPNPPEWKPTPAPAAAAAPPATPPGRREARQLSPGAFAQPRPRQTDTTEAPKVFSVASLLDEPKAADEPPPPRELAPEPAASPEPVTAKSPALEPVTAKSPALEPVTARSPALEPAAPQPAAPQPAAPQPAADASPAWPEPAPPVLPSQPARWRADEPNPFAEDDDFKTIADVIPANAEASRSLQSEPSWRVARESAALGELQRWVQESRNPPRTRWEALVRKLRPWHQRVMAWATRQKLPRWSPYAAAGAVLLLGIVLLVAMCAGGDAAPTEPRAAPPAEQIEMEQDVVRPRPQPQPQP